jgi:hypothetical protein
VGPLTAICIALVAALVFVLWLGARERREAAKERADLYQRIQDPDVAVTEHVKASRPDRPRRRPIAADDDKRYLARDGADSE